MTSEIAIIGDMHIGIKGGDKHFLSFQMQWLEECLAKLQKRGITTVVQTGDFFDTRAHIKLNVLHAILTWFPETLIKYGIKDWITYGGNHDMFYRDSNDISSLKILDLIDRGYDAIDIRTYTSFVGTPTINGKRFAFVPWLNKNNQEQLLQELGKSKADYVFGHFEMEGMPMIPGGILCEHGLDVNDFKQFKRVISGHFHTISNQQNCTMVGSPYALNWGDVNDKRGFWILDTDADTLELIENEEHMTMFSVIEYDPDESYKPATYFDAYEGTIVKVLVNNKADEKHYKKFVELLTQSKFLEYKIIDSTTVVLDKVEISEEVLSLDTISAMGTYIDKQEDELVDKDALKALANEIYLEVISGE